MPLHCSVCYQPLSLGTLSARGFLCRKCTWLVRAASGASQKSGAVHWLPITAAAALCSVLLLALVAGLVWLRDHETRAAKRAFAEARTSPSATALKTLLHPPLLLRIQAEFQSAHVSVQPAGPKGTAPAAARAKPAAMPRTGVKGDWTLPSAVGPRLFTGPAAADANLVPVKLSDTELRPPRYAPSKYRALSQTPPAETCATSINFADSPAAAARQAAQEGKLLLVIHLSGNFEDEKFT